MAYFVWKKNHSRLIRSARVSSHVDDFNTRNKVLTAKLLRQGYRYHKLRKAFSKIYRRHFDIVSKVTYDANSTSRFKIIKRHETELKWIKLLQTYHSGALRDALEKLW